MDKSVYCKLDVAHRDVVDLQDRSGTKPRMSMIVGQSSDVQLKRVSTRAKRLTCMSPL
jgi:hypothetical protein